MSEPAARPTFISAVFYRDPMAALDWLEAAFGFELVELLVDSEGRLAHSEMPFGDGLIMVGGEWAGWTASPQAVRGRNTQCLRVRLDRGIDDHCERARTAGAVIAEEPADQFYGDRTYRAFDPEGHNWTFAQTVRPVPIEEMERETGLRFVPKPQRGRPQPGRSQS